MMSAADIFNASKPCDATLIRIVISVGKLPSMYVSVPIVVENAPILTVMQGGERLLAAIEIVNRDARYAYSLQRSFAFIHSRGREDETLCWCSRALSG